jgi:hypothetical protein
MLSHTFQVFETDRSYPLGDRVILVQSDVITDFVQLAVFVFHVDAVPFQPAELCFEINLYLCGLEVIYKVRFIFKEAKIPVPLEKFICYKFFLGQLFVERFFVYASKNLSLETFFIFVGFFYCLMKSFTHCLCRE